MVKNSQAKRYSLGVDYGTNSVRVLIVDVSDGTEIAEGVCAYPSGDEGILLNSDNPLVARQRPSDYISSLYKATEIAIARGWKQGFDASQVIGIGVDTTGSTPLPVDRNGWPLELNPKFKDNLAAQAWLWKDHSSYKEAAKITEAAATHKDKYLKKCGGGYSSEWFWSKIWHCKSESPQVFKAAWSWIELADFIPAFLTGNLNPETMPRSICAAGHKAMYNDKWGGLPKRDFLEKLDPGLATIRDHFNSQAIPSDQKAGDLIPEIAVKMGLPPGIPVAVGGIDAHLGAVGAGIKPGTLVKIIGTSTCDMMVHPLEKPLSDVPGLCGIVPHSIIPGMYGLEAGQSAVGDIFNWFVKNFAAADEEDVHGRLTDEASKLLPGESGLLALDWNNGNRNILIDPLLSGLLVGQTLHTTASDMYRALIEATAFGALTIIRQFERFGMPVKEVVNCGGIAEKNPFVMQIYADICNRPMKISRSAQSCALGAAILGAIVGGAYKTVSQAQKKMTGVKPDVFMPNRKAVAVYEKLYKLYSMLHDAFGLPKSKVSLYPVMKELIAIRESVKR